DAATLATRRRVSLPHDGVAGAWTFSHDGRWLAYQFSSALEPGDAWLCDVPSGMSLRLTSSPCAVDKSTLRAPVLERYASFDGESIPVFAYLPDSPPGERVPVVAVIHGGPESQARPAFGAVIAYLVARGYGVVVPNVRGSTGYGKRFHHLDDRRRRLDAVRDLAALHDWLAGREPFDAARAALFGGSYGGYMVLSGLAYQPERWAAAVDIVGVSNLATLLENTSPWRRKYREREYGTLAEDREFLESIAPVTHAERIRAPLFMIHGANDPRVPLSESRQIHDALTRRGVPCELHVYADEGHGLQKLVNRLDAYPKAVAFLDANLAGPRA
ncbi:MAG: alpha/beta fold hydrolase, partial [Gammaproteobacteria bacterium]|nr:alpha/beta fold hydrolase [Gammaproteobacteria bacterium]